VEKLLNYNICNSNNINKYYMDSLNNNKPNILEQLASYNSDNLDTYLSDLNSILFQQTELNDILKNKNHNDNIEYVKNFISRNKNQIVYQLDEINKITEKISAVCLENEKLENEKEEYKELINSNECIDIANKLSEIKKTKENMKAFLLKRGIYLSPN
tara:strand:- start:30791 stop:31264 length:474 start_codon:yes stop_codon:yes gene_type:complete